MRFTIAIVNNFQELRISNTTVEKVALFPSYRDDRLFSKSFKRRSMSSQFQSYLQSIRTEYEQRSRFYTPTDAEERKPFFNLIAETAEEKTHDANGKIREHTEIERLPVLEGLQKYAHDHVLLVGRPGSGKSTALEQLLLEWTERSLNDPTLPIPVLVQLKADLPILALIRAKLRKHGLRLSEDNVDQLLFEGKLRLLVDGINEIPKAELRRELQEFRDNNRNVPMVFTTRDLELGGTLGIEKKLRMQPLTHEQLKSFVGKYLPERGSEFLNRLSDRLTELAETPLLLKLLCDVFRLQGDLAQSRGALFRTFDQQYEEIKGALPVSEDFRRFKSELLQHLAFGMLEGDALEPQLRISRFEAEQRLEAFLKGRVSAPGQFAKEWLEDLLEHHLLQLADDPKQIEFHHQLFLEYYAAEALLNRVAWLEDDKLKREFLNFLKWTEPVALMLPLADDVQAMRIIMLVLDIDWTLGARLSRAIKMELRESAIRTIDMLDVPAWLKAQLLRETQSDYAVESLLVLLKHHNPSIHHRAAAALELIANEKVIFSLLEIMEHSNANANANVGWRVGHLLGLIGSEMAVPSLLKLLQHPDTHVGRSASEALELIKSDTAVPTLLELIEHSNSDVRWRAAWVLGELGTDMVMSGLFKLVEHPDLNVRRSVVSILGHGGGHVNAIPSLRKLLEDSDSRVRKSAKSALENIEAQMEVVEEDNTHPRRPWFVKIEKTTPVSVILKVIEGSNVYKGRDAALALGRAGDEEAIPSLLKLMEHSSPGVRKNAVLGLGKIGDKTAIPTLINSLKDSDADVRSNAAGALESIAKRDTAKELTDEIASHLPYLLALIPTDAGEAAYRVMLTIQENCEYYNYDIYQAYLEAQKADQQLPQNHDRSNITYEAKPDQNKVSPTQSTNIFNINHVGNINTGDVNIQGNQIGIQSDNTSSTTPQPDRPKSPTSSLTLFYSYSHKDESLRDELNTHLKLLQRQGIIDAWYDRDITAGTDWANAIDTRLNTADIILLLVSANFLASDYCYDKELTCALDRHTKGEARVIPILLKPCDWESAPFGKLQGLPTAHSTGIKPVTLWDNQDEAFCAIAQGIRKVAQELRQN